MLNDNICSKVNFMFHKGNDNEVEFQEIKSFYDQEIELFFQALGALGVRLG
jgi:hypothetical protein